MSNSGMNRRCVAWTAALLLAIPTLVFADGRKLDAQAAEEEAQAVAAIQRALKAYVFISSRGSGVLISADGFILTNDHVAGSMPTWRVRTQNGNTYDARLVGTDPWGDISLLKIDGPTDLPFIELGDSDSCEVGETVIAIGNPFGMSNIDENPTVTTGLISAVCRPMISNGQPDSVMTDAPLNPGNSGGPLIDMHGRLVGINGQINTRHATRTNTGIGYAISVTQIKRFLPVLKAADGRMVHHGLVTGLRFKGIGQLPHVGIEELLRFSRTTLYAPLMKLVGRADMPVSQVSDGAAKAGLAVGDVITSVDGHAVATPAHAMARLASYPAGAKAVLSVRRAGAAIDVPVTLEEMPIAGDADLAVTYMSSSGKRVLVTAIVPDSPAARSGMQVGDRLASVCGLELAVESEKQLEQLPMILQRNVFAGFASKGGKAEVTVVRDGKPVELVLEIPTGVLDPGFAMGLPAVREDVRKLQVRTVIDHGPAAKAGVLEGDVILGLAFGGAEQLFDTPEKLEEFFAEDPRNPDKVRPRPDQTVQLLVERDGKRKVLDVRLGLKRENP